METVDYLKILVDEIHSVVVASTDENGLPTTRVIDMMLYDTDGVYFLTAKGKAFYKQLTEKPYVSLSGIAGEKGTMNKKSISFSGAVRCIGSEKRDEIFEKNPYMSTIYPTAISAEILEVFLLYIGQGEYFDLSTTPITRGSFTLGDTIEKRNGFEITEACIGCDACTKTCPTNCIEAGMPYRIVQEHCLHCGNCFACCPVDAIDKL